MKKILKLFLLLLLNSNKNVYMYINKNHKNKNGHNSGRYFKYKTTFSPPKRFNQ